MSDGPHIIAPTYRELEAERDGLKAQLTSLERLSKWQWSRIAACFRAAKKILDDDECGVFERAVDNDAQGGIRMDPRLPLPDAIDKENTR